MTRQSYLGSKGAAGAHQIIIALMPPHDTYIETHLGTGVVMRNKAPAANNIGIEIDAETIDEYWQDPPPYVDVHHCRAEAFIDNFDYTDQSVLIYADPPYLHSTRGKDRYRHDYTEKDHVRLLRSLMLISDKANIILSGYPNELYGGILRKWNSFEFQSMTRGGVRTEKLWFNFEPGAKHWASFAGKNFTDRQRIKRKAERWAANYRALPADEQIAVLSAMLADVV